MRYETILYTNSPLTALLSRCWARRCAPLAGRPALTSVRIVVSVVRETGENYLATNMADTRTANISKLVIKQAGRAKEKVTARTNTVWSVRE